MEAQSTMQIYSSVRSSADLCKGWEKILNNELLDQVKTRPYSA